MFSDVTDIDDVLNILDEYAVLDSSPTEIRRYIERNIRNHTFVNVIHLISLLTSEEKAIFLSLIQHDYFGIALYDDIKILRRIFYLLLPDNDFRRMKIVLERIHRYTHVQGLLGKKIEGFIDNYYHHMIDMLLSLYMNGDIADVQEFISEKHPNLPRLYPLLLIMSEDEKELDRIIRQYSKDDVKNLAEEITSEPLGYIRSYYSKYPDKVRDRLLKEKFIPYLKKVLR